MKKLNAFMVYLLIEAVWNFAGSFVWSVMGLYRIQVVGMNPLELVLAGTALELACLLFEVPTGVVADAYSRRLSVILSYALMGAGILIQGLAPYVAVILLMEAVTGIGYTFSSGALDAWITDEVGEERVTRVFLRAVQLGNLCQIAAILAGVGLASVVSLRLPIILGGGLMLLLAGFLALFMPEHGFKPLPKSERSSWHTMANTWREAIRVVRKRHAAMAILGIGVVFGLYSEGIDRLWEAHFLTNFAFPGSAILQPVLWFGILRMGSAVISLLGAEFLVRRLETKGNRVLAPMLFVLTACLASGLVGFALAGGFWLAVGAYWFICATRSMMYPLYRAWLNQSINPQVRATVLSVSAQTDALGQFMGGPVIGYVGTVRGLRAAILTGAALLLPALPLFGYVLGKKDKTLIPTEEPAPVSGGQ